MDTARHMFKSLRPNHWVKSGFCLAALFFAGKVFEAGAWIAVLPLVIVFSLVASGGYVFNDIRNREEDLLHPRKKSRPIASGLITPRQAYGLLSFCYLSAAILLLSVYGTGMTTWSVLGYVFINTLYTVWLRKIPVLDITTISLGFVLRVVAGAYALEVEPSEWLMLLTYLLALLLGLGKRRGEVVRLTQKEVALGLTRKALSWYSEKGRMAVWVLIAITFLAYVVYCYKVRAFTGFWATSIPVALALSSYGREVNHSAEAETPEKMLLRRPLIWGSLLVWGVMVILFV